MPISDQLVDIDVAILARAAEFNEVVRAVFKNIEGRWHEVPTPTEEQLVKQVMQIMKTKGDKFVNKDGLPIDLNVPRPIYNARLPVNYVARPTQSLLQRWLR